MPLQSPDDNDADLDGFDFILEEDGDESKGPSSLDFLYCPSEKPESCSLNYMTMYDIDDNEANDSTRYNVNGYRPRRSQRDRLPISQAQCSDEQRLEFEASAEICSQDDRQMSHSDTSMCSTSASQPTNHHQYLSNAQYNDNALQLQNLAESMKRTEESRQVVMLMQRKILTIEQQQALSLAKERVQRQNQQVQSSASMAAFFSGSQGGTLTSGLEQGRKQLGMYMSQVSGSGRTFRQDIIY